MFLGLFGQFFFRFAGALSDGSDSDRRTRLLQIAAAPGSTFFPPFEFAGQAHLLPAIFFNQGHSALEFFEFLLHGL